MLNLESVEEAKIFKLNFGPWFFVVVTVILSLQTPIDAILGLLLMLYLPPQNKDFINIFRMSKWVLLKTAIIFLVRIIDIDRNKEERQKKKKHKNNKYSKFANIEVK